MNHAWKKTDFLEKLIFLEQTSEREKEKNRTHFPFVQILMKIAIWKKKF
jgi:hypothetical protein